MLLKEPNIYVWAYVQRVGEFWVHLFALKKYNQDISSFIAQKGSK